MKKLITSNQDILDLISCEKRFLTKPKKPYDVNQSVTQRFSVFSGVDELQFDVFISSSKKMSRDFSLGLMYSDFLLYRLNGFHGTNRLGFYTIDHHAHPHEHMLTMADIENGRAKRPSQHSDLTGEYIDIFTARLYFFKRCAILGFEEFFEGNQQISLFGEEGSDLDGSDGSD